MGIKCGIVGLPIVGKSTLFNALTKTAAAQAANYPFCTIEPNVGRVAVPDPRLDKIAAIASSQKIIPTQLEFVDRAQLELLDKANEKLNIIYQGINTAPRLVNIADTKQLQGELDALKEKAEGLSRELLQLADQALPPFLSLMDNASLEKFREETGLTEEKLQLLIKALQESREAKAAADKQNADESTKTLNAQTTKQLASFELQIKQLRIQTDETISEYEKQRQSVSAKYDAEIKKAQSTKQIVVALEELKTLELLKIQQSFDKVLTDAFNKRKKEADDIVAAYIEAQSKIKFDPVDIPDQIIPNIPDKIFEDFDKLIGLSRNFGGVISSTFQSAFKEGESALDTFQDKFNVTDENQNLLYQVKGKFMSLHNKLELTNKDGDLLYQSKKKLLRILPKYSIFDKSGQEVASIVSKFSFKPKFNLSILRNEQTVEGSIFAHSFSILDNKGIVASISKKIISWGDTYEIEIYEDEKYAQNQH